MTTASRSLATALWGARFASGLLPKSYTTGWDTTNARGRRGAKPQEQALFKTPGSRTDAARSSSMSEEFPRL